MLTGAYDPKDLIPFGMHGPNAFYWIYTLVSVPLFLFMYFMLFYISNYVYYLITVEIPFLRFSADVGYLIANGVGMGTFTAILVLALLVQAARGRRGFGWSAIRIFVLLNYLLTAAFLKTN